MKSGWIVHLCRGSFSTLRTIKSSMAASALRFSSNSKSTYSLFSIFSSSTPTDSLFFSCSCFFSSNSGNEGDSKSTSTSKSSDPFTSYLNEVRASLKHSENQRRNMPRPQRSTAPLVPPPKPISTEEIRQNLSVFRRLSRPPPPGSRPPFSTDEQFKKDVQGKLEDNAVNKFSFSLIRDKLRNMQSTGSDSRQKVSAGVDSTPWSDDILKPKPMVVGDAAPLPVAVFGKEMKERRKNDEMLRTSLVRSYSVDELGEKLRALRPDMKGSNWFSLKELNERLGSLREMEEKSIQKSEARYFFGLTEHIQELERKNNEKSRMATYQRISLLGQLGATPTLMLGPPKAHLVEKYFSPDKLPAAEKMKIELHKVRAEFKMSESDCGSTPVQIAQLTTKINYLTSVLAKKDVHNRRGLKGMVERRKKLMKYLRRTDWDSYCNVISKLGLRDIPPLKT